MSAVGTAELTHDYLCETVTLSGSLFGEAYELTLDLHPTSGALGLLCPECNYWFRANMLLMGRLEAGGLRFGCTECIRPPLVGPSLAEVRNALSFLANPRLSPAARGPGSRGSGS